MNEVIDREIVEIAEYSELDKENVLESVIFTKNVREVRRSAFKMCRRLRTITFEEGIRNIDEAAFFGCESVEEIKFPSSLETIGREAFRLCKALARVEISDELLLAIPPNVFAQCPCEEEMNNRKEELEVRQRIESERCRILQYRNFFNNLFDQVMVGRNLDYADSYKSVCERFAAANTIVATDTAVLRQLYEERDNHVANVDRGCVSSMFANYNARHADSLTWETIDKECLARIAMTIKSISEINKESLREIDRLWHDFRRVLGNLNFRLVFTRMIAALRPDLVAPVVHPEAINELYDWFTKNGFLQEMEQFNGRYAWLRNWFVQNNQIKRFLTICLERDKYAIGSFVWYFVEAFRECEQRRQTVIERQNLIRDLIARGGYSTPTGWRDEDDELNP